MSFKKVANFSIPYLQILDEAGELDEALEPNLEDELLLRMYREMLFAREADNKMLKLQRQGKLGTFPPTIGQEASFVPPALAMEASDWLVPTYREAAARIIRGDSLANILKYYNGFEEGSTLSAEKRILPLQVILGAQTLHAVGIAYGMKYKKEKNSAVLTFFGDGASSEGDVSEAMNFAGVWKAPVVFICQNNGWAISTARDIQTSSETIAQKAIAYGFKGIQVDGNDPLAMYKATKDALDNARNGNGPTLIEAITYRISMHTTADDPTKYRDESEVTPWLKRDPITRLKKYLTKKNLLNSDLEKNITKNVQEDLTAALKEFESFTNYEMDENFNHVFEDEHYTLTRQREEFQKRVSKEVNNG